MQELPDDVLSEVFVRLARPGPMALSCRAAATAAAKVRDSAQMLGRWAIERFGGDDAVYHACVKSRDDVLRAVLSVSSVAPAASHLEYCFFRSIENRTCTAPIAEALLRGGADPNTQIRPLLHMACATSGIDTVRALLDAGAKPDAYDNYKVRPLELAQRLGRSDVADLLRARLPPPVEGAKVANSPGPELPKVVEAMSVQETADLIARHLANPVV